MLRASLSPAGGGNRQRQARSTARAGVASTLSPFLEAPLDTLWSEAHCLPFLSSETCSGSPWSPQIGVQTSSDVGAVRFASDENKNSEWLTEKSKEPAFIKGQAHSQFAFRHSLIQELNGVPRIRTIFSHLSALPLLRGLFSNRFSCQMARGL